MRDFLGYTPHLFYPHPEPRPYMYDWQSHQAKLKEMALQLCYEVNIGLRNPISFELYQVFWENPLYDNLRRTIAVARGA